MWNAEAHCAFGSLALHHFNTKKYWEYARLYSPPKKQLKRILEQKQQQVYFRHLEWKQVLQPKYKESCKWQ